MSTVNHTMYRCRVIIAVTLLLPVAGFCQDPKGLYPGPPGMNAFMFYYRHIEGDEKYVDGNEKANAVSFDMDLAMLRVIHFFPIGSTGWTFGPNLIVPFGSKHQEQTSPLPSGGYFNQTSTGFGDPQAVFILYSPTPKGANGVQLMFAQYITVPMGDYHNDQAVNMGSNRWAFKEELGIGWKPIKKLTLEPIVNCEFYTKNDDYGIGPYGTSGELKQDPLFNALMHISWDFTDNLFMTITPNYTWGGKTKVNGIDGGNVETWSGWFTAGIKLNPNNQILLQLVHDFDVKNGIAQNQVRIRYAFFCHHRRETRPKSSE